jgi:hypothetical protein
MRNPVPLGDNPVLDEKGEPARIQNNRRPSRGPQDAATEQQEAPATAE